MSERLWEVEITWTAIAYAWAASAADARDVVDVTEMLDYAEEEHIDAAPVDRKPATYYDAHPVYSDIDAELTLDVARAWALQEERRVARDQQAAAAALQGKML